MNAQSAENTSTDRHPDGVPRQSAMPAAQSVLPELRPMWWESGARTRAQVGMFAVFAELPRLLIAAVRLSWGADRLRTVLVAVATISGGGLAAFGLLATSRVLVELFAAGPTPQRLTAALPALAALAAATGLRAGLGIASGYAQNALTPRVDREVERSLFEVTTTVRLDAFDADAFADDMERASRGTESAVGLVQGAMNLLAGLAGLLAVAVAVLIIHPLLLVALLVATVPNAWAALRAGQQRYQTFIAGSVRRRRLWLLHQLMATRDSAAELRSYGLRRFLLDQYDRVMGAETDIQLALARKVTTTTSVGSAIGGLATTGVYILLGALLLDGRIPIAAAATCVIAVQAAQRSLTTVTLYIDRIYTDGQHFSDYTGFMTRAAEYLPGTATGGERTAQGAGPLERLDVRGVGFSYPDRDSPAVDDVTLSIHAGQTVAFVGENGSGKTSLAAIIAALRQPDTGAVEWNGRPLDAWDPATLRPRIAVVTQDFHKFPFTAATNIAIGDSDAEPDRTRIETAAARAAAHDMIMELPHGYETLLDRTFANGQDLSGGQWQRITAARGFLRTADLLIMDEPSSALDPRAEDALFQAIRGRQGHATTILITHRLANVRHADRIYVLHHGALVEAGTHDELMATGGQYAGLFRLQAAGYAADPIPAKHADFGLEKLVDVHRVPPADTARLSFAEMTVDDLDDMAALLGDADVMRYYPRPKTRDEALSWITWNQDGYQRKGFGLWVIRARATGEFVGDCGLTLQEVEGISEVEVGYHVRADLQGRGYATEAAAACREHAQQVLGLSRLIAIIDPDNEPSQRVAEKIGLRFERDATYRAGQQRVRIYAASL